MRFKLSEKFVDSYKSKKPPFGFNGLGELVYRRTYSRIKTDSTNEEWYETVERVVNGTYNMQKEHIEKAALGWNSHKAQKSAQEMYDRMYNMKFLPPGRGLWAMGSPIIEDKKLYAALNNCSYVSTEFLKDDPAKPFCFLMDASMLGVGVGFDTKGSGQIIIKGPDSKRTKDVYVISDDREGWVESLRRLIESYFYGTAIVEFDYSKVRKAGEVIKTFGGTSSGPEPLMQLHDNVRKFLDKDVGQLMTMTNIVDVMNMIGKCVVSGNVRRSAEIVFGDANDEDYLDLKDYTKNPRREEFGWASNNSVVVEVGHSYKKASERTRINGEPGYFWIDNAKAYGRMADPINNKDSKSTGCNPCVEQTLESYELCCVSKDTPLQTRLGIRHIVDTVGKIIEVWNGDNWSKVTPFLAGSNKTLYRVTISDGSYLDCTDDHKWSVKSKTGKVYKQVTTKELFKGDVVSEFIIDKEYSGVYNENAYEWGLFAGDGYIDKNYPMLIVCGDKKKLIDLGIKGRLYKEQIKEGYTNPVNRINLVDYLNLEQATELNDKTKGLPIWVSQMDKNSLLEFVAGYIETDGNVCHQVNTDNYRLFGTEKKIRDMQLLLRRVGINHSTIYCVGEEGEETNFGIRNYSLWCCYIPSYECSIIPTRIKVATRFGSRYKINNAYPESVIDAARNQKIVSVEELPGLHNTYCFSEPINHMGVFGNVLTYQCLVESFPARHESLDDYKRTLKFAYLYAKTVTLGNTHWPETNRVMLRNRRIGCSVSGVAQFLAKHGIEPLRKWLEEGYSTIQRYDEDYSNWLCIPRSIKTTSVKPSGSVSLLAGATPGMHFPEARFYIRRVRMSKNSTLVEPLRKAGYHIEPATGEEEQSVAVEIPVDVGENVRVLKDVSMWEQLALAAFLQKYWSDNQVSSTITFNPDTEGPQLEHALNFYQYQLKGISFLPRKSEGAYKQMPYEAITEDLFKELNKNLKKVNFKKVTNEKANIEVFCDGDTCTFDPKALIAAKAKAEGEKNVG